MAKLKAALLCVVFALASTVPANAGPDGAAAWPGLPVRQAPAAMPGNLHVRNIIMPAGQFHGKLPAAPLPPGQLHQALPAAPEPVYDKVPDLPGTEIHYSQLPRDPRVADPVKQVLGAMRDMQNLEARDPRIAPMPPQRPDRPDRAGGPNPELSKLQAQQDHLDKMSRDLQRDAAARLASRLDHINRGVDQMISSALKSHGIYSFRRDPQTRQFNFSPSDARRVNELNPKDRAAFDRIMSEGAAAREKAMRIERDSPERQLILKRAERKQAMIDKRKEYNQKRIEKAQSGVKPTPKGKR